MRHGSRSVLRFIGSPGWVRFRAWLRLFLSKITVSFGAFRYCFSSVTSSVLVANSRSFSSLTVFVRCGFAPYVFPRCIVLRLTLARHLAIVRNLRRVVLFGFLFHVGVSLRFSHVEFFCYEIVQFAGFLFQGVHVFLVFLQLFFKDFIWFAIYVVVQLMEGRFRLVDIRAQLATAFVVFFFFSISTLHHILLAFSGKFHLCNVFVNFFSARCNLYLCICFCLSKFYGCICLFLKQIYTK